jgi:hypothetical protein
MKLSYLSKAPIKVSTDPSASSFIGALMTKSVSNSNLILQHLSPNPDIVYR